MKNKTNQELAKLLFQTDWIGIQVGAEPDGERMKLIVSEIEDRFSKEEAIRFMLKVLEATWLLSEENEPDNPFKDIAQFNNLNLNGWNTDDYKTISYQDPKDNELRGDEFR